MEEMIDEHDVQEAADILKANTPLFHGLGDEIRQKLMIDISLAGSKGVNVSDLHKGTLLSRPAISHHLKVLKDCKLVKFYKVGTQIFYYANLEESLNQLSAFLEMEKRLIESVRKKMALN